jgi:hypothetical protein
VVPPCFDQCLATILSAITTRQALILIPGDNGPDRENCRCGVSYNGSFSDSQATFGTMRTGEGLQPHGLLSLTEQCAYSSCSTS